jgi:hypothetical protein
MLNQRTWEACPIDCTKALGNIYENRFQTYRPKGKTYRDAQLEEIVHSIMVEHASEHEVVCGSEPAGEKREEGETAAKWKALRALGCEAATSSCG